LRFGSSIEAPEYAHQEVRLQRRLRPVHPAVDPGTRRGIGRPEAAGAIARGEITQDGVGFPHHGFAIPDHGHPAVRIHGQEVWPIEPAKVAARIDMFVRETKLADQPHHFLDVE
jgi:hypothetical protein